MWMSEQLELFHALYTSGLCSEARGCLSERLEFFCALYMTDRCSEARGRWYHVQEWVIGTSLCSLHGWPLLWGKAAYTVWISERLELLRDRGLLVSCKWEPILNPCKPPLLSRTFLSRTLLLSRQLRGVRRTRELRHIACCPSPCRPLLRVHKLVNHWICMGAAKVERQQLFIPKVNWPALAHHLPISSCCGFCLHGSVTKGERRWMDGLSIA